MGTMGRQQVGHDRAQRNGWVIIPRKLRRFVKRQTSKLRRRTGDYRRNWRGWVT